MIPVSRMKKYCTCDCCSRIFYDPDETIYLLDPEIFCTDCFVQTVTSEFYGGDVIDTDALADAFGVNTLTAGEFSRLFE